MCRRKVEFKVRDGVLARRTFQVNSGEFITIYKNDFGIIRSINDGTAVVTFCKDGIDHEVMVRFDYLKKAK